MFTTTSVYCTGKNKFKSPCVHYPDLSNIFHVCFRPLKQKQTLQKQVNFPINTICILHLICIPSLPLVTILLNIPCTFLYLYYISIHRQVVDVFCMFSKQVYITLSISFYNSSFSICSSDSSILIQVVLVHSSCLLYSIPIN